MEILVNNIIPFSNVEGKGNRCSVFLQGCDIRCLYCHNPETISMKSKGAVWYTIEALAEKIVGYMPFIRGVTISGGEPTVQAESVKALFDLLRTYGLTCYVDTNGFFLYKKIKPLISVTDKFLFDVKGFGSELQSLCFENKTMPSDNRALNNLQCLLELNKVEEVRLVYIKGFYDVDETIKKICYAIKPYPTVLLKLIRVHMRGIKNSRIKQSNVPSQEEMLDLEQSAHDLGITHTKVIL